jgi:hypothetical protein
MVAVSVNSTAPSASHTTHENSDPGRRERLNMRRQPACAQNPQTTTSISWKISSELVAGAMASPFDHRRTRP